MVSNTQQTNKVRERHHRKAGKRRKRLMRSQGTPSFPIHLPGYDPKAADAPGSAASPKSEGADKG